MKMALSDPVGSFRIRPVPHGEKFFIVVVEKNDRALRKAIAAFGGDDPALERLVGCCYGVRGHGVFAHAIGVIFLSRARLGAGYVGHELAHAAFRALEAEGDRVRHGPRVGGRTIESRHHSTEERYCLILEELTREFWREAQRVGL